MRVSLVILVCLAAALFSSVVAAQETISLLAVEPTSPWTLQELQRLPVELVSYDPDRGLTYVLADPSQMALLRQQGHRFSTVQPDVDAARRRLASKADLGAYTTHAELVQELERLATTHPEYCRLSVIGQSVEGRPIHALKISDAPQTEDATEPDVLIVGNHHARELMTVEVPLHLARTLLEQAGRNGRIGDLVDSREIWIVPMLNPDGHVFQEINQGIPGWRKNRRVNDDLTIGVDLNRNYSYKWGLDDVGSSSQSLDETYRGPAPFSEPETAALRSLVRSRDFVIALSYHSFGKLLLYPWGWSDRILTPDHSVFVALADSLVRGNNYRAGNPFLGTIYLVNGEFDDYMYGEINADKTQQTFSFTVELNSGEEGGFWPDESFIQPTCDEMLPLNLYAIQVASDDLRSVLPPPPPIVTLVQSQQEPWRLDLTWTHAADVANQVHHYEVFEIDPLGVAAWKNTGRVQLQESARGLLGESIRVPDGGQISLKLTTDLQGLWDYLYVEARHPDGREWTALAGSRTTGANPTGFNDGNGLTQSLQDARVTFDATAFAGERIDLAVRLAAHQDSPRPAFVEARIDLPHTLGELRRVLADNIQDTHYTVIVERSGIFAYGVSAVDDQGQRTDSDLTFVHIPTVTEVMVQDVIVHRVDDRVSLQWRVVSSTEGRFEAWTRPLQQGESPGGLQVEWDSGLYRQVAEMRAPAPGIHSLEWQTSERRQAVVLVGTDADGSRFWGPWVSATVYATLLHPAVPNPFNPQTRIRYELSRPGDVQLAIFGADGRQVRRLVHGLQDAGSHDKIWDGRDDQGRLVASGVYMARFLAAGVARSQRLVLLR